MRGFFQGFLLVLLVGLVLLAEFLLGPGAVGEGGAPLPHAASPPWWVVVLVLLALNFVLGIICVLAGMGGGTLFVPLVSGFLPIHLDFVRSAGLLVALSGALAAAPALLRSRMADLRLALTVGLAASSGAVVGARVGLALPSPFLHTALGVMVLTVAGLMLTIRRSEAPEVREMDPLARLLSLEGAYLDLASGEVVSWKLHRTAGALMVFLGVGFLAGIFGIGAGWANVPTMNLLMGAPIKVAVATSKFLISIVDVGAAWVYISSGAVLPLIVLPSVIGMMLGSWLGPRLLARTRPSTVRYIVVLILLFAGLRSLLKGLGI